MSTNPVEDWVVCERISFAEGLDVGRVYVTTTSDSFVDNTEFAAVFTEQDYIQSVQVYSSSNNGRDWEFMFSTNETDYNPYTWGFSFSYYHGMIMLTGRFSGPENSFLGNLGYSISSKTFSLTNFTSMVNHSIWESTASAGSDSFYVCCTSRMNGTMGITYFQLSDAGWSSTFRPVPDLLGIQVSNMPALGEDPYVLYRDGNKHLRVVRFNDSAVIYNVTAEYDGVWDFNIVCSSDSIAISYLDGIENETLIQDVYHIDVGSETLGFSHVIEIYRSEYLRPVLLSYLNSTDTFCTVLSIAGNLTYFVITGSGVTNRSLDIEGASYYYSMSRIDFSSSPLFLTNTQTGYNQDSISLITWIGCPIDPERVIGYYPYTAPRFILPVYFFPTIVLGFIIIMYFAFSKSERVSRALRESKLQSRASRIKTNLVSTVLERTSRFRLFFLSPLILGFNIILSVAIFHLAMQLPFVGTTLSHVLHDFRSINFLDPLSLLITLTMICAFLIYLVDLKKPVSHFKCLIWCAAIGFSVLSITGWTVGLLLVIFTFSIWVPLWCLTDLEISHTRWHHILKATNESLSEINQADEEKDVVTVIIEVLEYLRKKNIIFLNELLTDKVMFSQNSMVVADSVYDVLLDLRSNKALSEDRTFIKLLTSLEQHLNKTQSLDST